jgi:predicted phosphodiesterase
MRKIVTLLILLLCFQFPETTWSQSIVYPWRAAAAIVRSGESFEVWFNANAGQTVQSVSLKGPYNSVATKHSIQTGSWIYDCTSLNTYNTKITVTVPQTAPAERYDIIVNTSSGPVTSLAGVKVIKEYKDSYYILHFSDIHAFQNGYKTTLNRLSTVVDIANIINPEMVFNTGDNLYRPSDDRMNQLFSGNKAQGLKGLNDLNAAAFTVVGNHDTDFDKVPEEGFYPEKSKWWNQWWGLQAYHFNYNNGRFIVINNGWVGFDPSKQIQEATAWLKEAGKGNFRLGAAHIKESELLDLDKNLNLNMVLVGHNHHIANTNPGLINAKTIQYISNSMRDHVEFNLYKINGKTGIAVPFSGPTAQVEYLENPEDQNTPSSYKPKLVLMYASPNDGKNTTNTATLVNKFNFGIEDARVRFVMPLGTKYTISKGKIEQSFDGQSYHIVDVNLNLEPNSTNTIEILTLKK